MVSCAQLCWSDCQTLCIWVYEFFLSVRKVYNSTLFSKSTKEKTASVARNWTNFAPQTDATTFTLAFVLIHLLCLMYSVVQYTVPKLFQIKNFWLSFCLQTILSIDLHCSVLYIWYCKCILNLLYNSPEDSLIKILKDIYYIFIIFI